MVAGKLDELDKLRETLKASGYKCARVNVPYAYHTEAMAPILDELTTIASEVKLSAPALPIISNARGAVVRPGDSSIFTAQYFAHHCGEPVKFEQGIHDLRTGHDFDCPCTYIEIGPHPTTLSMLRYSSHLGQADAYLPSLKKNSGDWSTLDRSLAELYCSSSAVNWRKVFADCAPGARLIDLPAYPFAKTHFYVPYTEKSAGRNVETPPTPLSTRFKLLGACLSLPPPESSEPALFETPIDHLSDLIEGHKVAEFGLCPASVYIEMAMAATQLLLEHFGYSPADQPISVSGMAFPSPLVYAKDIPKIIRISVSLTGAESRRAGTFGVSSFVAGSTEMQSHCSGTVSVSAASSTKEKLSFSSTMVDRRRHAVLAGDGSKRAETFRTRMLYDVIFSRIVSYSPMYHAIKSISLDSNGVDAFAVMQLPTDTVSGGFMVNPVFTDALLHAAGFVLNCSVGKNEAFICSQVDKIKILPELIKTEAQYGVYCNIGFLSETLAIADAYAFELGRPEVTIVAHIKRMRFRKLRLSTFKSVLSLAASQPEQPHRPQPAIRDLQTPSRSNPTRQSSHSKARPAPLPQLEVRPDVKRVKNVMATVLGMQPQDLSEDDDLERLGLDSLTSIEARHALCSAFSITLPENLFNTCKTMRQVCSAVYFSLQPTELPPTPVTARSDTSLYDREILKVPDTLQTSYTEQLRTILASVLGIAVQDLGVDQDLERLGLDSLMSIEAQHAISTTLDIKLPDNLFASCKTIRDLGSSIDASQYGPGSAFGFATKTTSFGTEINPVRLQFDESSDAPPLFLIHDGSGIAKCYGRLSSVGRTVWGIHNPKFPTGEKWEGGLVAMAEHYAALIRSKLSTGQGCIVGGT